MPLLLSLRAMDKTLGDIKSFTTDELKEYFRSIGEMPFRAEQVLEWAFGRGVTSFDDMTNVSKKTRAMLKENFTLRTMTEAGRQVSTDGTVKWLFRTHDGHHIETVMIPAMERNSICVSTQVGCAMGCRFCRTATMGFLRNLSVGEIIEQYLNVQAFLQEQGKDITNIIFMGMGEPMKNFTNVNKVCFILHNQKYFGLGRRRITISTSGVVPSIYKLIEAKTPARLAISLNGTNNEMRSSIMPVNDTHSLDDLLTAVDDYVKATGDDLTFEFVLIKDITCTPKAAEELIKICAPRKAKVNAIALNANENDALQPPSQEEIDEFFRIVRASQVHITQRAPRGRDILAACGQLAVKEKKVA